MIFSEETVDAFRKDFNEAMNALREKYDISISLGTITYFPDHFTGKLSVFNSQDDEAIAIAKFDANVWKFHDLGLQKGMYKRIFIGIDGERYALIGLNARATKNQLEIMHLETGTRYTAGKGFLKELTDFTYVEAK